MAIYSGFPISMVIFHSYVGLPEGIVGRSFFHISIVVEKSCGSLGILTISKAQFPTSGRLIPQALEVWWSSLKQAPGGDLIKLPGLITRG